MFTGRNENCEKDDRHKETCAEEIFLLHKKALVLLFTLVVILQSQSLECCQLDIAASEALAVKYKIKTVTHE